MRHGDAEYPTGGGADAQRRLTDWGRVQAETMAGVVKRAGDIPDQIVASPYVRAQQTAQILARTLGLSEKMETGRLLSPAASHDDLTAVVREYREAETLLLVGHMPSMGTFAGSLIAEHAAIDMPTAAIAAIRLDTLVGNLHGTLMWYAPPRIVG